MMASLSSSLAFAAAPVFNAVSDQFIQEGETLRLDVKATDADSNPLVLGASKRPLGATFTDNGNGTGRLIWDAAFTGPNSSISSPFLVEFFVSDGTSITKMQVNVYVQNVNRKPSVVAPDTIFVEAGDAIDFQVSAFDPDLEPVNWAAPTAPVDSRLVSSSGQSLAAFQWTPEKADSGVTHVEFVASDSWGLSDTAMTTVVVSIGPDYTLSIPTDTVYPGETLEMTIGLDNIAPISGFNLFIHYDPSVMSFLSISRSGLRSSVFQSVGYTLGNPAPGDMRIQGTKGSGTNIPAGNGGLLKVSFVVSSQTGIAGLFLPVTFRFYQPSNGVDNTMSDSVGVIIPVSGIVYANGGAKIHSQSAIKRGDINLNGIAFEVADALRYTNYFIDPIRFGFTAQQFANSDINQDGITASVADLVSILNIVVGGKIVTSVSGAALGTFHTNTASRSVTFESESSLGAALMVFAKTSSSAVGADVRLSDEARAAGMTLETSDAGSTVRALLYSRDGQYLNSGVSSIVLWNGDMALRSVEAATADGRMFTVTLRDGDESVKPAKFGLSQNYPNPFNPSTEIAFTLEHASDVKLVIYDALGRRVRILASGSFNAGESRVTWDGTDESGSTVASGMYFYRLTANGQSLSKKMILLK